MSEGGGSGRGARESYKREDECQEEKVIEVVECAGLSLTNSDRRSAFSEPSQAEAIQTSLYVAPCCSLKLNQYVPLGSVLAVGYYNR